MQQLSVAAVNRCVVRNGGAKAANQHVAGLRTGCADTVKPRRLQIIQIEIVTMPPPVVVPVKIRHINPRQMIGITEQRVAVRHAMLKLPPGQVWHAAEFMYPVITDQPPVQPALYLEGTIRTAETGLTVRMAVYQRHDVAAVPGIQVILRGYTKIHRGFSRQIFTRKIPLSLCRSDHITARFRRRTLSGMCQNVIVNHGNLLRQFVDGSEKSGIHQIVTHFTAFHAVAAFILFRV